MSDYVPDYNLSNGHLMKYTFKDLSSTTVPATMWYAFDENDSVVNNGIIDNKGTGGSSFDITTSTLAQDQIVLENDGLELGSSMIVEYTLKFVEQDPQDTILQAQQQYQQLLLFPLLL